MHQHPRVPPITASQARSAQTNPMRSNNSRDQHTHTRNTSEVSASGEQGIYMTEGGHATSSSRDTSPEGKLDLIVQNYFYKAALMILDARTNLPQAYTARDNKPRVNRWFNTELPETDELLDSTRQWKNASALRNRPPNMVIETYIDLKDLASNQKLVIGDESGKRQDVELALREHLCGHVTSDAQIRKYTILLERWVCELDKPWPELDENFPFNEVLPKVYKGSIVLYRSLFAHLKFMPAWKFYKRTIKSHPGQMVPRLRWRIYDPTENRSWSSFDALETPLLGEQGNVTDTIHWDPVDSPAGQFSIKATYRLNCDFRIETSESLFNSQFMASDEKWFQPSLPRSSVLDVQKSVRQYPVEIGSLPRDAKDMSARHKLNEIAEQGPAYGSMSTFHNTGGKIGTSPLSALRAARELHAKSPTELSPQHVAEGRPGLSNYTSRRSYDAAGAMTRRTSVSIQPFKTPSFSSSVPVDQIVPPSPRMASTNRNSPLAALAEARNPYVVPQSPSSPRTSPKLAEVLPVGSFASSPRPTPARFSSSFSHRRNRPSTGTTSSRGEEDNIGSDRGSASSSNLHSGAPADVAGSNSIQTDDDNISDFLKMLDSKKELKSFRVAHSVTTASGVRSTTAALNKFQQLRDSHAALSDSLSSSQMLRRSSVSSSSRQLANVPQMVAGTSTSIASSPGERVSPRTPHTPAIPSRLSSNSIIEYNQTERGQRQRPHRFSDGDDATGRVRDIESNQTATSTRAENVQTVGAIPIPTSPRAYQPSYRRSSSAAARNHNRDRSVRHDRYDVADEIGDILPFALRSASLGDGEEREPLSLSGIVRLQEAAVPIPTGIPPSTNLNDQNLVEVRDSPRSTQNEAVLQHGREEMRDNQENDTANRIASLQSSGGPRSLVRHSFSRPSGLTNFEDEEPLLFAMSEQLEERGADNSSSREPINHGSAVVGSGGSPARDGRMQQW